jgi:hypothetical protein
MSKSEADALQDLVDRAQPQPTHAEVARDFELAPPLNGDGSVPSFAPTNPRVLNDTEQRQVAELEARYAELWTYLQALGHSRELALARTKTEEACMWAVKHVTG